MSDCEILEVNETSSPLVFFAVFHLVLLFVVKEVS